MIRKAMKVMTFIFAAIILFLLGLGIYLYNKSPQLLQILTGYSAKIMCSCHYVAERTPEHILQRELAFYSNYVKTEIDEVNKIVTATSGKAISKAIYREGLGCSLMADMSKEALLDQLSRKVPVKQAPLMNVAWPLGDSIPANSSSAVDLEAVNKALEYAFSTTEEGEAKGTHAVVVVHDSLLIAEQYAEGFTPQMPLKGWSMTKSVTQALVGILEREGKLDIHKPAEVPQWYEQENDPRQAVTLDQLLRMSSGLEFWEFYFWLTDAVKMLFILPDASGYASSLPQEHEPDTKWSYSSGTTNIISGIVRRAVPDSAYWTFPQDSLFNQIGMRSAVMEPDASGTFVGSSFMHATPRDWARFGLLYLWEGNWNGKQILNPDWVKYAAEPTPTAGGIYGAQFWTNADNPETGERRWPSVPDDLFFASGFEGQYVFIIPSRDLVVVRLGSTPERSRFSEEVFLSTLLEGIPE